MSNKTLLFVGAHPDDETFGLGGTLAQYALSGVQVYYACATRGEAGSYDSAALRGHATPGDMRWAELECAVRVLKLAGVIHLGYRDSGMPGWEDNKHSRALMTAPIEQVAAQIVKVIRDIKPQVLITHDPIGGYRHPDHIAVHNAAVQAFHAAGDAAMYPEAGAAFQPNKLYFSIFPHRLLRIAVKLMPLFGQDPHHFGRNRDIDLTSLTFTEFPINAAVHIEKQALKVRDRASACYISQHSGEPPGSKLLFLFRRLFSQHDYFMRAYPPVNNRLREKDLFEGIR